MLTASQLEWLRNHLRLGDKMVFSEMENVMKRIKEEGQLSREKANVRLV